jgi:hypothetical protein
MEIAIFIKQQEITMVYVDGMKAPYRNMVMCHMLADTTEELLAMADKIGVDRKWLQKAGTAQEHFDICMTKRAQAVKNGATEISTRQLATLLKEKRNKR